MKKRVKKVKKLRKVKKKKRKKGKRKREKIKREKIKREKRRKRTEKKRKKGKRNLSFIGKISFTGNSLEMHWHSIHWKIIGNDRKLNRMPEDIVLKGLPFQ